MAPLPSWIVSLSDASSTISLIQKRHGGGSRTAAALEGENNGGGSGQMEVMNVVALVVSALAFLATVGQLLQQYVATADGYRRCGDSVMGPWGRKTKLRWRWREFRFECLYCVPYIEYSLPTRHEDGTRTVAPFCEEPDLTTFNPNPPTKTRDWNAELAGWVHLLHNLGLHDQHIRRCTRAVDIRDPHRMAYHDWLRCSKVEIASRSWDFVPDDVLRPLAITTLAGLVATTRRLGMTWKQFEPNTGTLQAEGNYQVITSTVIRGMGVIIHYLRDSAMDTDPLSQIHLLRTSPLLQADEMLYGRIGHADMFNLHHNLPHLTLHIGCITDVVATLPVLFSTTEAAEAISNALRVQSEAGNKNWMESVNDLVPFITPFLGMEKNARPVIPWPNSSARGMTHTAFRPFQDELTALLARRGSDASADSHSLYGHFQTLSARFQTATVRRGDNHFSWETPKSTFKSDIWSCEPADTLAIYNVMMKCETMLNKSAVVRAGRYHTLIAEHLLISTHIEPAATDADKMRHMFSVLADIAHAVRAEWDGQGEVLEAVVVKSQYGKMAEVKTEWITRPSGMEVEDAWLSMMMRAMCWQRLHVVQAGITLPMEYSTSMLPVFIA